MSRKRPVTFVDGDGEETMLFSPALKKKGTGNTPAADLVSGGGADNSLVLPATPAGSAPPVDVEASADGAAGDASAPSYALVALFSGDNHPPSAGKEWTAEEALEAADRVTARWSQKDNGDFAAGDRYVVVDEGSPALAGRGETLAVADRYVSRSQLEVAVHANGVVLARTLGSNACTIIRGAGSTASARGNAELLRRGETRPVAEGDVIFLLEHLKYPLVVATRAGPLCPMGATSSSASAACPALTRRASSAGQASSAVAMRTLSRYRSVGGGSLLRRMTSNLTVSRLVGGREDWPVDVVERAASPGASESDPASGPASRGADAARGLGSAIVGGGGVPDFPFVTDDDFPAPLDARRGREPAGGVGVVVIEGNIGAGKSTLTRAMAASSMCTVRLAAEPLPPTECLAAFYGDPASFAYPIQLWFRYHRAIEVLRAWRLVLTGNADEMKFLEGGATHISFSKEHGGDGAGGDDAGDDDNGDDDDGEGDAGDDDDGEGDGDDGSPVLLLLDRGPEGDTVFAELQAEDGNITAGCLRRYTDLGSRADALLPRPIATVILDVPAKVCHERVARRARDGEAGVSLEYLQRLQDAHEQLANKYGDAVTVIANTDADDGGIRQRAAHVVGLARAAMCDGIDFGPAAYERARLGVLALRSLFLEEVETAIARLRKARATSQ